MTTATSQSSSQLADQVVDRAEVAKGDVLTTHYNKTWTQFEHLQRAFENSPGVRLSYYNATIRLLMPGRAHEIFKSLIGFLIEIFLYHQRIDYIAIGSTTQATEGVAAAEPDESYEIQNFRLAVEVNFTSGDVSKLARYQALGFDEVWIWEDGVLEIYQLQSDSYQKGDRSIIPALSSLDMTLMSQCILLGETSRTKAADKLLGK